jgi:hypothetical protein
MSSRCCVRVFVCLFVWVCVCVSHIVARQRLGFLYGPCRIKGKYVNISSQNFLFQNKESRFKRTLADIYEQEIETTIEQYD